MPRISLWRENRSHDYKFFNDRAREQFTIGGTGINIHKYLGSDNGDGTSPELPQYSNQSEQNIQDLLFLENRDRIYDPDVYNLRGHYNVNDMDFDLSQFGLFLQNDTLFITFHLTDMVERLGRKIMSGDVLELPHLRDDWPLEDTVPYALRKYYVVQDATRAAEGYSSTWWPHLWRVKATPMVNSQEYQDILDNAVDEESGNPLGEILSTYNKEIGINDAVVEQAKLDVPAAGYNTDDLYTLPTKEDDSVNVYDAPTADDISITTDSGKYTADLEKASPTASAYDGYLTGDGLAPSGFPVQSATSFPSDPDEGDFVLRLDFYPNRLFRYDGNKWVKIEDKVRYSYIPDESRSQLGSFINTAEEFNTNDGRTFNTQQALSSAIKPKADNT